MAVTTINRVPKHTPPRINKAIIDETKARVREYVGKGNEDIEDRLVELDQEWDIERAIEVNAAMASLDGVALGATLDRRWLALPGAVAAFLLQHALLGWCPPVPVLRRMGFRTSREIEIERNALKAVRGDFGGLVEKPSAKRTPRREPVPAAR
jgi:hypothetical protein